MGKKIEKDLRPKLKNLIEKFSEDVTEEKIEELFSLMQVPESCQFIKTALERFAQLNDDCLLKLSDVEFDSKFQCAIETAQKIIQSSLWAQLQAAVKKHYKREYDLCIFEWRESFKEPLKMAEVQDKLFMRLLGGFQNNPIYVSLIYPVMDEQLPLEWQAAISQHQLFAGVILNHYFCQKHEEKEEGEYESLEKDLYKYTLKLRQHEVSPAYNRSFKGRNLEGLKHYALLLGSLGAKYTSILTFIFKPKKKASKKASQSPSRKNFIAKPINHGFIQQEFNHFNVTALSDSNKEVILLGESLHDESQDIDTSPEGFVEWILFSDPSVTLQSARVKSQSMLKYLRKSRLFLLNSLTRKSCNELLDSLESFAKKGKGTLQNQRAIIYLVVTFLRVDFLKMLI